MQRPKKKMCFGAMWSNYWDKDIALRQEKAVKPLVKRKSR